MCPLVFSQTQRNSLCIVDTRLERVHPYDPPAGPFAIGMYQQLAGRKLKDGSALHIIVLPASPQPEIGAEVQRLRCSWAVQLWFHQYADEVDQPQSRATWYEALHFKLWDGRTTKVIDSGSGIVSLRGPLLTPFATFRKQILKTLNHLADGR
jgi:hypothetical protein